MKSFETAEKPIHELGPLEKGAIPVTTTDACADRVRARLDLPFGAGLERRLAALRDVTLREADLFVNKLPSVHLKTEELAAFRVVLGGDPEMESALTGILDYKEDLRSFIDFLFLLRSIVHDELSSRSELTQGEIDAATLRILGSWAGKYGYAGIREISDRDTAEVFTSSIRRGELQYDLFFRGQLYETLVRPWYNMHGDLAHVIQWIYYSWRHDRAHPLPEGVNQAMAWLYRKVPDVSICELFRRLSDTLNSSVQLVLRPGHPPNARDLLVNYRGFPKSVTDPASVTRLYEIVFYNSLDPERPVRMEPVKLMGVRPTVEEFFDLYRPETEDERRRWAERSPAFARAVVDAANEAASRPPRGRPGER